MTDIPALIQANSSRWNKMVVNPSISSQVSSNASRLTSPTAMARYNSVSRATGVPANIIAVIHERESGQSWASSLAQGDPWNVVSTHVPKGRGPFNSWEDAAIDALVNCAPYASKWKDWSPGGSLTLLEEYNGLGYANRGLPSPYIWAGTNQYVKGKYVADGVFDPNAVDKQIGCAALLRQMGAIPVVPIPTPTSEPWYVTLIKAIISIFKGK